MAAIRAFIGASVVVEGKRGRVASLDKVMTGGRGRPATMATVNLDDGATGTFALKQLKVVSDVVA